MKHFITQISSDGVVFTSVDNGGNKTEKHFDFKDRNDHRYKEQLSEFLSTAQLNDREHSEHTVSWSGFRTTLVPSTVFGESDPQHIFRLCFGNDVPEGDIDYNRLSEMSIVNVFELPVWVKSFFVMRYPRSVIQHEGSVLLRSFMYNPPLKLKILLIPYRNHFMLFIADKGKLQFYSVFDQNGNEDILYNLMFTLQQKELTDQEGELIWCNGNGSVVDFSNFSEMVERVQNLKKLKLSKEADYILKAHQLCV